MTDDEEKALRALAEYVQCLWDGGHFSVLGRPQQFELEDLLEAVK